MAREFDGQGYPIYQYPFELQPGKIRLLKFIPQLRDGGLLYFEFLTISLLPEGSSQDCETPYFALSYVWGPETDKVCIQIDG